MQRYSGDKKLSDALSLMNDEGVSSLAVVDNNNNVVGNISTVDVKVSYFDLHALCRFMTWGLGLVRLANLVVSDSSLQAPAHSRYFDNPAFISYPLSSAKEVSWMGKTLSLSSTSIRSPPYLTQSPNYSLPNRIGTHYHSAFI